MLSLLWLQTARTAHLFALSHCCTENAPLQEQSVPVSHLTAHMHTMFPPHALSVDSHGSSQDSKA